MNCNHPKIVCPEHGGGFDCTPFCSTCEGEQEYCNQWHDEDEVVTNYKSIRLSSMQAYDLGWQKAIEMVLDVCGEMYNDFDKATLQELEQRIV